MDVQAKTFVQQNLVPHSHTSMQDDCIIRCDTQERVGSPQLVGCVGEESGIDDITTELRLQQRSTCLSSSVQLKQSQNDVACTTTAQGASHVLGLLDRAACNLCDWSAARATLGGNSMVKHKE